MSWAIERDEQGLPVRMIWMGHQPKRAPVEVKKTGCPICGYHFGWHKRGCTAPTVEGK